MSVDTKFFARPKVRFCQTDTNETVKKEFENSANSKCENNVSNKPRVRSILTLDRPIKLVKLNKTPDIEEFKEPKIANLQNVNLALSNSPIHSPNITPLSCSGNMDSPGVENQPLNNANSTQNIKANSKKIDIQKASFGSSNKGVIYATATQKVKDTNKALKPKDYIKGNSSKKSSTKIKNEKENGVVITGKATNTASIKSSSSRILKSKDKHSFIGSTTKPSNITNEPSVIDIPQKTKNLKPMIIGVMPCHKHNKGVSKIKTPTVKKTVIRDIVGPKLKSSIGPGVSRKRSDIKCSTTDEDKPIKSIVSGEKLARPEYNSIMCTINKLNDIKKQKVVIDMEHFPSGYKNLVNGKISTALDFPLDEAIYKNLVDLTIDENQLPCRLMRSKDPEPRQRDIVPVLSDFFTPTSTEEYCAAMPIKARTPESVDSWNAFRISDQINEWKYTLNHI